MRSRRRGAAPRFAAELAEHWYRAGQPGEALTWAVRAAGRAEGVYAHREAARHCERVLELWDQVPDPAGRAGADRAELHTRAARAWEEAGDETAALAHTEDALRLVDPATDPVRASLLHTLRGWYEAGTNDLDLVLAAHVVAELEGAQGQLETALARLSQAQRQRRGRLGPERARELGQRQAEVQLWLGRPETALLTVLTMLDTITGTGQDRFAGRLLCLGARALAEQAQARQDPAVRQGLRQQGSLLARRLAEMTHHPFHAGALMPGTAAADQVGRRPAGARRGIARAVVRCGRGRARSGGSGQASGCSRNRHDLSS